jgi:hypothetical protein
MATARYSAPTRVSVICYLLFGYAATLLLGAVLVVAFPRFHSPPLAQVLPVAITHLVQGLIITLCAAFMLTGANWARIVYFVYCLGDLLQIIFLGHYTSLTFEVFALAVLTVFFGGMLITYSSNRFFSGKDPTRAAPKSSSAPPGDRTRPDHFDY